MKVSVIIPTYNRARELRKTLDSLAKITSHQTWEVIVADNNSTDDTATVVAEIAETYPVELRYVFEGQQGRPAALNAGIGISRGEILAFTDDDHRFEVDWIVQAARAVEHLDCDYAGGKILPLWEGSLPRWFSTKSARHRAVVGMADYGSEVRELGEGPAMGGNMVVWRDAFDKAGMWDNQVGRKAGTLLGQEVREWCMRARAAGLRGKYIPEMVVYHVVPAERLTKRYFRRWFYWHGISRAILYEKLGMDMESPEESLLDFSTVPHIAGVPRYLFRTCVDSFAKMLRALLRRDLPKAFDEELWLWFFAGILKQRWRNRRMPIPSRKNSAKQPEVVGL